MGTVRRNGKHPDRTQWRGDDSQRPLSEKGWRQARGLVLTGILVTALSLLPVRDANGTGISGVTTSFGNNRIFSNAAAGTPPTAAGASSPALGQQ